MPKKKSGIFITFEGTEGAGKSTLIREVGLRLPAAGVTITREPGGSLISENIRKVILSDFPGESMDPWTELFLYEAARAQHLAQTVRPALEKNGIVLCDRYTDSTLAYQGHARGLPWSKIGLLNRLATQGLVPDLTIFLDIDPAVGLARVRERNRFENEGVEFQRKVRSGFLKARKETPRRWLMLHSDQGTPQENADRVTLEILNRFAKKIPALQRGVRGQK